MPPGDFGKESKAILQRPIRRSAAAVAIMIAALGVGCLDVLHWSGDQISNAGSSFRSVRAIEEAERAIEQARSDGTADAYPYLIAKASALVRKARDRYDIKDFPGAERLAAQASSTCEEAVRFVEDRAERRRVRRGESGSAGLSDEPGALRERGSAP